MLERKIIKVEVRIVADDKKKTYLKIEEKVEFVIRKVLEQGRLSTVELIEMFQREKGLPKSTARSSVSQVLQELIDMDILKVVDYGARGVRVIDLAPYGVEAITMYLVRGHRDTPLWEDELGLLLSKALIRIGQPETLRLIHVYHEFSREVPLEEESEEEEKTLYDFIESYTWFETEKIPASWGELKKKLVHEIVSIVVNDILREWGGEEKLRKVITRIQERYKNAPLPQLKDDEMLYTLTQVLATAKDYVESEINELERVRKKLSEIYEELKSKP